MGNEEKRIFGVSWTVFMLGIVSFLNDMSSEMIIPIMPSYLTEVLDAGKLLSGSVMGAIESMSSLFKVAFGYVSDRFRKRKVFVFTGYALSTLAKGALAFTRYWWDFLIMRTLDRVGKGIRTAPRDALIAESSEKGKTGRSFGFHRMMDTLGAVAGPLVAIGLIELLKGLPAERAYRYIFLLSAVPGIISLLVIALFVRDRGGEVKKKIKGISTLKDRNLQLFLTVVAIGALGRYSYAFTMWKAQELGYSIVQSIAFYALFNLVYALSAYPIGTYSDGFGKKRMITLGFGVAALAALAFAYARDLYTLLLAFAVYGVYIAIEDTVPRAYMADLAREYEKGTVIGAYHTVFGVFVFPASVIAGFLWQSYSLTSAFTFSALMNVVAMVLMAFVREG
ncbi:MFS transporter [Thermococcus celer]|uniref:MFS transporter n=1 Tax=Thermococcus celer Vu 13 = JCM 8558 TaxID=1293037 RepID=A0A218P013_THECE|nr:MFS transporter [Thermococcus celer]ASI98274.1 MFS transporter [Thermococcus celer] [Thermococcus celer Vu 13 = JCM 8558]